MTTRTEPQLALPGAGLPGIELRVARLLFALRRHLGTPRSFDARFQKERQLIRGLVHSCDAQAGARRVLIRRPPGLEDSSRYWSVWMTLDHLQIVHHEFVRVISALTQGILPAGTASTAAVKPRIDADASIVGAYEHSCDALVAAVADAPDLKTSLRFAHPWFGPLDAAGWHALAPGHMTIHRVQIERILVGLSSVLA